MNRLKLVIVLGFAIMFVAGLTVGLTPPVAGWVSPRTSSAGPTTKPDEDHPPLGYPADLHLTAAQDAQIKEIWKQARTQAEAQTPKFHELDRERDDAMTALLTPEQKSRYDAIRHDHEAKAAALRSQIRDVMHDAETKTKALLTPEQQVKFAELLKHRRPGGPPGIGGAPPPLGLGMGHHHGPHGAPHTEPADPDSPAPETAPFPR